ncbi:hypothetical protein PspS49_11085 [Pseudomonas sp. S49]|nr:hypothetical protein PspS49_11085 [Pseudomonas sp. S49]
MASSASPSKTGLLPFASRLAPTRDLHPSHSLTVHHHPLWERACSRRRHLPHRPNRVGPIREQARSHKALRCAYWLGGAGSGSLVTRSSPHNPEVLP